MESVYFGPVLLQFVTHGMLRSGSPAAFVPAGARTQVGAVRPLVNESS